LKKGCFIQSVIIVTILIAAAVYIIKYKLEDWVVKPGKKILITEVGNNWENETAFIKESPEKDSLRLLLKYYLENIKTMEDVVNLEQDKFLNELKLVIDDSLVNDAELSKLTSLLKKEEYEKFKSNRN
jgi:tRNA C32,U32 (ribose-2'-O)-methylase TrmJ